MSSLKVGTSLRIVPTRCHRLPIPRRRNGSRRGRHEGDSEDRRTTRVAARRCSAGNTASRDGSPLRSGVTVAVEARKTGMAFTSGGLTLLGGTAPVPLLTRTAAGSRTPGMQSANASATLGLVLCRPLLRPRLPPELLLNRLRYEVHERDVVGHAVELEATVKLLRDARRQLRPRFLGLRHLMPPWSWSQDHADACDGGERSSSSPPSSCAPSSRRPPSADDRDHRGATSRAPCDDGADRSSPSASCRRRFRVATGSRSGPPPEPRRGSRSANFSVSTSFLPSVSGNRFFRSSITARTAAFRRRLTVNMASRPASGARPTSRNGHAIAFSTWNGLTRTTFRAGFALQMIRALVSGWCVGFVVVVVVAPVGLKQTDDRAWQGPSLAHGAVTPHRSATIHGESRTKPSVAGSPLSIQPRRAGGEDNLPVAAHLGYDEHLVRRDSQQVPFLPAAEHHRCLDERSGAVTPCVPRSVPVLHCRASSEHEQHSSEQT